MARIFRLEAEGGPVLAEHAAVASNPMARFAGLMFRRELPEGEALVLRPCNSIHMFFMRFPLDVVFVDAEWRVVRILDGIKPWRASSLVRHAKAAIELPAGTARRCGLTPGATLRMVARD